MATEGENDRRRRSHSSVERSWTEDIPLSPTILPWDRFSNWVHCFCVVTFDLELGQAMEVTYPGHIILSEKEKMNICYLSFPDSNSGCMGDTQFHFRICQCPDKKHFAVSLTEYNRDCPSPLQSDSTYYYGYVYFRQTRDKSVRRGYYQKSVVLLSKLPFIKLFYHVVSIVAPEYFSNGEPGLEAACHDIDQWQVPVPGDLLHLPLMGTVVQGRIPCRTDRLFAPTQPKNNPVPMIPANCILSSVYEVELFSAFQPVLPHIQMLWELVMTGEPIVVMATLPAITANTVQALVSMLWPLRHCSDYRPYFTIHDSEFKEYTAKTSNGLHPVILGVTNPFFAKTLQHWPHIIRIGEFKEATKFNKIKKGGDLKTLDSKPGVYTRYKPFLMKDKAILKQLLKGVTTRRPVEVQSAMLKRYFLELTQSFMIPLERYMASLMPLQKSISPFKNPPDLRHFDTEEFLRTIEHSGPHLTSGIKGDWIGLYRKFFSSPNFRGWFSSRHLEVNQKLQAIQVEALSQADLKKYIEGKQEVEVVDVVLRLKDKVKRARTGHIPVSEAIIEKLQCHLETVVSALPTDTQVVLQQRSRHVSGSLG